MEYFLYLMGGVIAVCSILLMIRPKRVKRIIYNLAYLLPLWSWGIILLILSALVWHSGTISSFRILTYIIFVLLFIKGLIVLFLPKRRTKKSLEWFLASDEKVIRKLAVAFLIIGLMILLSV